jgi:hypothetical protein
MMPTFNPFFDLNEEAWNNIRANEHLIEKLKEVDSKTFLRSHVGTYLEIVTLYIEEMMQRSELFSVRLRKRFPQFLGFLESNICVSQRCLKLAGNQISEFCSIYEAI